MITEFVQPKANQVFLPDISFTTKYKMLKYFDEFVARLTFSAKDFDLVTRLQN